MKNVKSKVKRQSMGLTRREWCFLVVAQALGILFWMGIGAGVGFEIGRNSPGEASPWIWGQPPPPGYAVKNIWGHTNISIIRVRD